MEIRILNNFINNQPNLECRPIPESFNFEGILDRNFCGVLQKECKSTFPNFIGEGNENKNTQ